MRSFSNCIFFGAMDLKISPVKKFWESVFFGQSVFFGIGESVFFGEILRILFFFREFTLRMETGKWRTFRPSDSLSFCKGMSRTHRDNDRISPSRVFDGQINCTNGKDIKRWTWLVVEGNKNSNQTPRHIYDGNWPWYMFNLL